MTTATTKMLRAFIAVTAGLDVLILLAALGLHGWALHYVAGSLSFAHGANIHPNVPFAVLFTRTGPQTRTRYATTTTRPATTFVMPATTSVVIEGSAHILTTTLERQTFTLSEATIAYSPTQTVTRVLTSTGLDPERAYQFPAYSSIPFNRDTPASTSSATKMATTTVSPAPTAPLPTSSVTLYFPDFSSYDSSSPNYFGLYQTVGLNHGFGKYFVEADIVQDYGDYSHTPGYPQQSEARLGALVALIVLAILATFARIGAAVVRGRSLSPMSSLPPRKHQRFISPTTATLLAIDVVATFVLFATLLALWCVYGAWTRQTDMTRAAFRWFNSQPLYNYLLIDDLFDAHPWPAKAVAYVVMWTASVLSSLLVTVQQLRR